MRGEHGLGTDAYLQPYGLLTPAAGVPSFSHSRSVFGMDEVTGGVLLGPDFTAFLRPDLHLGLDFHGDVEGELGHPDGGPRVSAAVGSEDLEEQLRTAVDDG